MPCRVIDRLRLGAIRSKQVLVPSRKTTCRLLHRPYRIPTQVGECECTQAREIALSKELGKLAP
jgi:hypothetical protein